MTSKNSFYQIVYFAIVSLILVGCQSKQPVEYYEGSVRPIITQKLPTAPVAPQRSAQTTHRAKVALLLPLSGNNAQLGQSMLQAAQMSLFDNSTDTVELSIHDTQGNPNGARQAAQMAVAEGTQMIIGPIFSEEALAVAEITSGTGVPVLSFSNDSRVARNNVYTLGFSPTDQVKRILRMASTHNIRHIGVLVPNSAYGRVLQNIIQSQAPNAGIKIATIVNYKPGATDYAQEARQIKQVQIEGLFIPEGGQQLRQLASALLYHDVDLSNVRLLGTGKWDTPDIENNTEVVGGWFATTPQNARKNFEAKYQAKFGAMPQKLTTLAYDAVGIAQALASTTSTQPFNTLSLTNTGGFAGVDGIFRLLPDGRTERSLTVLEVAHNGLRTISAAQITF